MHYYYPLNLVIRSFELRIYTLFSREFHIKIAATHLGQFMFAVKRTHFFVMRITIWNSVIIEITYQGACMLYATADDQ